MSASSPSHTAVSHLQFEGSPINNRGNLNASGSDQQIREYDLQAAVIHLLKLESQKDQETEEAV